MSMIELNVLTDSLIPLEVMGGGSGGITPIGTKQISITENGTTTENVYSYADAEITVDVPQPSGTKSVSITSNGTTTEDVTSYASASINVNVLNSYSASDEGKVVSNGALVSQSSATYTVNGTYDTTLVDDVTVNVASSGGISVDDIADGSITGDITITVTNIREYAFRMTNVTGVTADNVTILRQQIFNQCTRLTKISFARAYTVNGSQQFLGCTNLTDINLPLLQTPGGNMFQACKALEFVDFPSITRMNFARLFYDCNKLKTIVLRHTSVVPLNNDVFTNTPFNGYGGLTGTVYVPSSLIESYKTATNWSTLYNNGTCNFVAIEGSEYE